MLSTPVRLVGGLLVLAVAAVAPTTPAGPDTARVTGDLLLNDVTAPVTLDVTLRRLGKHPMTGQPSAGFDITGSLKRSDFGLGAFAPAIGDEVGLEISVEAAKG